MKKTVVLALLALTSVSAFASKARLEALGEDKSGSYYIQDNRDMFLNPAHVNYHKDFLTFEFGGAKATPDTAVAPRAEGGFFRSMGALNYGLYLGNQDDRVMQKRYVTSDANFTNLSNPVDLFVGGEAASMKWGANLTYSTGGSQAPGAFKKTQDYLGAKVGVEMANLEVFAQADIMNKTKGGTQANDEFNGNFGGRLGATYMLNDLKVYGSYGRYSSDFKDDTGTAVNKTKYADQDWKLGVGRTASLNDKTKIFTRVEYNSGNNSAKRVDNNSYSSTAYNGSFATNAYIGTGKYWNVPVAVGIEHDALSWLMLRGSVTQDLWNASNVDTTSGGTVGNTYTKRANNTAVNMGATLALGSVKLDGLVGTSSTGSTANNGNGTTNGIISLDNLMTRVALRYNF